MFAGIFLINWAVTVLVFTVLHSSRLGLPWFQLPLLRLVDYLEVQKGVCCKTLFVGMFVTCWHHWEIICVLIILLDFYMIFAGFVGIKSTLPIISLPDWYNAVNSTPNQLILMVLNKMWNNTKTLQRVTNTFMTRQQYIQWTDTHLLPTAVIASVLCRPSYSSLIKAFRMTSSNNALIGSMRSARDGWSMSAFKCQCSD